MKKIICILLCIFFMSGCTLTYDDVFNSLDKMLEISNSEINDYKIEASIISDKGVTNYSLIKDGKNYYASVKDETYYLIYNNNYYHIYYKSGDNKYHYKHFDLERILNDIYYNVDMNPSINQTHVNISNNIRGMLNRCLDNDEYITCNIERKRLKEIEVITKTIYDISSRENTYIISNGRLMYLSSKYIDIDESYNYTTIMEFDYKDQKLKEFDKSEYKIKENS